MNKEEGKKTDFVIALGGGLLLGLVAILLLTIRIVLLNLYSESDSLLNGLDLKFIFSMAFASFGIGSIAIYCWLFKSNK